MRRYGWLFLGCSLAIGGCDESGEKVLGIDATGELRGTAFLDRNDDLVFTQPIDVLFPMLRVSLAPVSGSPVVTTTTDSLGRFQFSKVWVGSYRITIDNASVGDTIRVVRIDSAQVTVGAQDTLRPVITLGYASATIQQVKGKPVGSRVTVSANALNAWVTFGDSTVHLADSTGAIRAVEVTPLLIDAGDRLRVLATVSRRAGEVTLKELSIITSSDAALPTPASATTASAAAAGGPLDAAQVRVTAATVLDAVSLPSNDLLLTVNDQSGPLEVLIDGNAGIATSLPMEQGAELDLTGVLVPSSTGTGPWRLKPRHSADITVRYPPMPVRTARSRPSGRFLSVHAIALHSSNAFGDNTAHVADTSAAIRLISHRPALFSAGDSLNVVGRLQIVDGQPVIFDGAVSVLGRRTVPPPITLTTLRAASADSARADAALVQVINVTVDTTIAIGPDFQLRVNDGTGVLDVLLDRDSGIYSAYAKGTTLDVVGVLIPIGTTGRWVLKPRQPSDVVVK